MPNVQFYVDADTFKEIKRLSDFKRITTNEYCKQRVIASIKAIKKPPTTDTM